MTLDEPHATEEKPYRPFRILVTVRKRPASSSDGMPMISLHLEQIVAKTLHGEWEEPPNRWKQMTDLLPFIRGDERCVGLDCVYSLDSTSEDPRERHDRRGPYHLVERRYTHDLRLRIKKIDS